MTVKVVLADDQKIVRDGLALVLRQLPASNWSPPRRTARRPWPWPPSTAPT
jgi:hypothetical protein